MRAVSVPSLLKPQYLKIALIGALGILLLLVGTFYTGAKPGREAKQASSVSLADEEKSISRMVEEAVSAIRGVGRVQARVTLEMGPESVYARSVTTSRTTQTEIASSGERRENIAENESSQPVTGRFGTSESPLVEKVVPVRVGGCLIVAEGASSSKVKLDIYRAVSTLLNLPMHKIMVEPMKGGK